MIATNPQGLASLGQLKKILLGGEALPPTLVRQLRRAFRGEIYNMYGPTETTIWSTTCQVCGGGEDVTIGKPIVNTQVYVLKSDLTPVAEGEAGNLFIGGDGVARGYWRRDSTDEKFLGDPFLPGNRMYRTGDIARFLPDGNMEFLGRADFQVKLRGFRIEIGEIESALEKQAGVSGAIVVVHEFKTRESMFEDKRLVAYIVSQPGATLKMASLRAALASVLPEHMVPSRFVPLSSFP